jgi:glyoxylase-like metal-dependent hydrolase (beta-lactamase superfamily II)
MNAYALVCPTSGQSVLIDPGADPEALLEMLGGSDPVGILITHGHLDHVNALEEVRARLNVPVMAHPNCDVEADRRLDHGDTLSVGQHRIRVYHTPGHTDHQLCFALWDQAGEGDQRVVVGDTIFEGGPGHTRSPQDFETTRQTLRDVILPWSDEARCYPGHGPHFRLGDKRAHINAFLDKDHGDFCGDATWDM